MRIGDHFIQSWRIRVAARWIPKGGRILDIGCHQGEFIKFLGNKIEPSVGLDPLYEGNGRFKNHQFFAKEFHEGMPFEDGSFDAVTLLATLEHMHDKAAVAREAYRLLKPGGHVVITVPSPFVDTILSVLLLIGVVDGMSLDEHHGFLPEEIPYIVTPQGFRLIKLQKFQLGLNNLFVFEKL